MHTSKTIQEIYFITTAAITGAFYINPHLLESTSEWDKETHFMIFDILNTVYKILLTLHVYLWSWNNHNKRRPLHLFLSDGVGIGKTMTTKLLYQCILKYENSQPGKDHTTLKILLLAPTGKAAFFIQGNTIYSSLRIPVLQFPTHKPLDCNTKNSPCPAAWL